MKLVAILIAALAMTAAANAADRPHDRHAKHARQPPFDMPACLKAAEPIYASPEERKAVCDDMKAGV